MREWASKMGDCVHPKGGREPVVPLPLTPCPSNAEAQEILQGWNLRFDPELLNFDARVLPAEKIHQTQKTVSHSFSCALTALRCVPSVVLAH